jgi:membrane protein required for beta-lactamase induction
VIDHAVDRAAARAGRWRLSHRPRPHGADARRPGSAVPFFDRMVWLALFPVYLVVAVVITIAFGVAALITELRSRGGNAGSSD